MANDVLTDYEGAAEVYLGSLLLAELLNFRVRHRSNDNPVRTMQKGLAGFSNGPHEVEGEAENAIPKAGMEIEWDEVIRGKQSVRVSHVRGGKRRQYVGRLQEVDESYSTDSDARVNWTFLGKPARGR